MSRVEYQAKKLALEGWQNRGSFDEPRLSDVIEMYEESGFEVRVEAFEPEGENGCEFCMRADPDKYKTVYTRLKNGKE